CACGRSTRSRLSRSQTHASFAPRSAAAVRATRSSAWSRARSFSTRGSWSAPCPVGWDSIGRKIAHPSTRAVTGASAGRDLRDAFVEPPPVVRGTKTRALRRQPGDDTVLGGPQRDENDAAIGAPRAQRALGVPEGVGGVSERGAEAQDALARVEQHRPAAGIE